MSTGTSPSDDFDSQPQSQNGDEPAEAAGEEPAEPAGELTHCPHCKRKLLTTHSPLCSWCGEPIKDPDYLAKAAEARAAQDQALRQRMAKEAEEAEASRKAVFLPGQGEWNRLRNRKKSGLSPRNPLLDIDDLNPK